MTMTRVDPPDIDGNPNYNRCDKCNRFVSLYETQEHSAIGAMMGSEPGDDFITVTKKAPCKFCALEDWKRFRGFEL